MRRAIGYARVSTDVQAEKGMGLAVQRERIAEYAKEAGFELIASVQESASGGVRDGELFSWQHRPVLHGLLDRASAGDFDVLLVAHFDRLSRDYASLVL